MLTLRFESDSRGTGPDTTFVVETKEFRTNAKRDGSVDVLIPNENGVDIYHPLSFGEGGYDRCYVMNSAGATVARYHPGPERPGGADAAARPKGDEA